MLYNNLAFCDSLSGAGVVCLLFWRLDIHVIGILLASFSIQAGNIRGDLCGKKFWCLKSRRQSAPRTTTSASSFCPVVWPIRNLAKRFSFGLSLKRFAFLAALTAQSSSAWVAGRTSETGGGLMVGNPPTLSSKEEFPPRLIAHFG